MSGPYDERVAPDVQDRLDAAIAAVPVERFGLTTATAPAILPRRIPGPEIARPVRPETRVVDDLDADRY